MSDIKNLQKIVDDLNFAIEKLEDIEMIDEMPELISEIKIQVRSFKKQKLIINILTMFFVLSLSSFVGYFSAYKYTNNYLTKLNLGLLVVVHDTTKQIYIPKKWHLKELKNDYLFTKK